MNASNIMASKIFHLFLSSLYFYFFFFSLSHAHFSQWKYGIKSLPAESLEKLIGAQKGDKVAGLHDVKTYLTHLGYLDNKSSNNKAFDDVFDDPLELAVKKYQDFYNLNATGVLDSDTVTTMSHPRCGVPDLFHPNESLSEKPFAYHYAFFPGEPKWPVSQRKLKYSFATGTRKDAFDPVAHALRKWASVTDFKFTYSESYDKADIKLSFQHIDGPLNVLADSYPPTDGRVMFDVDENWSANVEPGKFDLETVGLHELGHILGLAHSDVPGSIMFPTIGPGIRKGLSSDDIDGIKTLYNLKKNLG